MKNETKIIDLKKVTSINPNKENLTVEKLKTFKGLENLNDEQATEMVFAIQTFANILYEFMNQKNPTEMKNEKTEDEFNPLKKAA
ncbi:MAG: hypothetical protein H0W61_13160 [Bacteroidetes bacterium]|nr:hypothetical protein [Bacteroidota bacterium]